MSGDDAGFAIFDEVPYFERTGRLFGIPGEVLDPDAEPDLFAPPAEPDHRPRARLPVPREPVIVDKPGRQCISADTPAHMIRPAPHPGPRCQTCHRAKLLTDKIRASDRARKRKFGITPEEYVALYRAQGGKCYVCQIATGKRKKLAVEHDHTLAMQHGHPPDRGCAKCITGLACGPCNENVLGRLGHQPAVYERLAEILRDPPARRLLEEMRSDVRS